MSGLEDCLAGEMKPVWRTEGVGPLSSRSESASATSRCSARDSAEEERWYFAFTDDRIELLDEDTLDRREWSDPRGEMRGLVRIW